MAKNKQQAGQMEMRAFDMPDITAEETGNIIEGHAAVFDQPYNICGWWEESIARGAFDNTDFSDVLFCINHDLSRIPLARSRNNNVNSTLQLGVDNIGLKTRADIDVENNSEARALRSSVIRGDIRGMSFIFTVRKDEWTDLDTDMPKRKILDIAKVYEVTAASTPASPGTDINARSKSALDSAKLPLESARARALDSANEQRDELELLRLKNDILLKG